MGRRLPRPHPGQPVQRRLLACSAPPGSSRCCAASATTWPAPGWSSSRPRASATSASTRSRSATTRRCRTCDDHVHLQERRQGDRRAGGHGAHLHGQVRRARGQLLPHPPAASAAPTARWCWPTATALSAVGRSLRRRAAGRTCASSRCSSRRTSTPTSASSRAPSPRPPCAGAATTAPARFRLVGHGASLRLENRVPGGDVNPYLATAADRRRRAWHGIEEELRARAGVRGQRLRRPGRRARADHACARPLDLWRSSDVRPPYLRRRRGRPLRQHGRASSWRPSARRSPTGSASGGSSGCEQ